MTQTIDQPATTITRPGTTARWLRLARGAAIAITAWMVLVTVTARIFIPPVVVLGFIALVFAWFLTGERRKTGLAFAVFSALALFGNIQGVIDELRNIDSTPAFVLTLLVTIGSVVGIVSGLGAFFAWTATPIRRIAWAGAAVFVVAGLVSAFAGAAADDATPLAGDAEVTVERLLYAPETVTVAAGDGLWVDNRDGIRHTFTVEALDLDLEVPALKARRIDVDGPPGTYAVICTVPGHENMAATLVIGG